MDLGFIRHPLARTDESSPDGIDFGVLRATLQAFQSATVTARAQAQPVAGGDIASSTQNPLVELLVAGPHWEEAIGEQGGCFNPAYARRRTIDV
jgi:hypothetical protein